jgi:hypothetical protein
VGQFNFFLNRFRLDSISYLVYLDDMKKQSHKGKKPDINELAHSIVEQSTNPDAEPEPLPDYGDKNPAAVELGRKGGLKGGKARAAKMTKAQRSGAARKAALARWTKGKTKP